jgi:CysZ protein
LFAVFCFVPVAGLVAAPFNDVLSDKVERLYAGGGVDEPFSLRYFGKTMWVSIKGSLWLALMTYGLMALALPLYLLPPPFGAMLGSGAQAYIAICYLALQFTAYSMDRRLYSNRERARFRREHRSRTMGLGAMSFLIMTAPVINALFIPVSAVAGTLLFCDAELRRGGG